MADVADLPAWLALFAGLFTLAAGVAELRDPGGWLAIGRDCTGAPLARFLAGLVVFALGAAVFLACWGRAGDWLAIAVSILGGVALVTGLMLIAVPDRVVVFARRFAHAGKGAGGAAMLGGAALLFVALGRLHPA